MSLPDMRRSMPQSLDAEKGVLCSCLLSPLNVLDACVNLPVSAFYQPSHGVIFEEMLAMHGAGMPIDFITLTERLKHKGLPDDATDQQRREYTGGTLEKAGGAAAISELFTFVPTASNADYYIDIVREKYHLRQLIHLCTKYAGRGYAEQGEVKVLFDEFEQEVLALGTEKIGGADALLPAKAFVEQALDGLEALYKNKGKPIGVSTGLPSLDRMTNGLKPTLLYVLAARPSVGKTVMGMQLAMHAVLREKVPAAVFSLEMSGQELAERMLGTEGNVNLQTLRLGLMSQHDVSKLTRAGSDIGRSKLFIDETSQLTIMELRARARRAVSQHGVKLIVVDYLQLMRAPSRRAEQSRQVEVADISSGLKAIAKELNVPVVVLAQLNRDADGRRPGLPHLRESGAIEQDADVVMLLHRPFKDKDKTDDQLEEFKTRGEPAELIIAKQRNGPIGEIELRFKGAVTRFEPENPDETFLSNNPKERQKS